MSVLRDSDASCDLHTVRVMTCMGSTYFPIICHLRSGDTVFMGLIQTLPSFFDVLALLPPYYPRASGLARNLPCLPSGTSTLCTCSAPESYDKRESVGLTYLRFVCITLADMYKKGVVATLCYLICPNGTFLPPRSASFSAVYMSPCTSTALSNIMSRRKNSRSISRSSRA